MNAVASRLGFASTLHHSPGIQFPNHYLDRPLPMVETAAQRDMFSCFSPTDVGGAGNLTSII
jgi:hypothetical protein